MLWCSVALLALFASAQGRAVNISNTWVLPEEGFPVFYRYFRDRISWYEADAVCQFHHANLVTVDTTAQYDAVRAYLKELDISSAVWVGLIRSNPDGDFTWTDYRGLSGEGYWSSAPDTHAAPLCAAADPAADYRWKALACGGPTVASFICELPVPQWALGNEGCMVRALPALTILYLPESASVQLTADCGLAGVKRVQCTGNVKREDLLRDLSCTDEEEVTTTVSINSSGNPWPTTSDAIFTEQEITTETSTEENGTTEHEDDINQTSTIIAPTQNVNGLTDYKMPPKSININKFNRIHNVLDKNLDLPLVHNNNLQSNFIPKIANEENYLSNEQKDKLEDEKHMQHKMLHEEIARLGNLENIFTQPTDHFVPPLVMAKAKISDDMTVLSLQEKHAQQLAEQHLPKQHLQYQRNDQVYENSALKSTTEEPKGVTIDKIPNSEGLKTKDNFKKDKIKNIMPKKYSDKVNDQKKIQKTVEFKPMTLDKINEPIFSTTEAVTKHIEVTSLLLVGKPDDDEESSLDLTVFLKERPETHEEKAFYNYSGDISRLEVVKNITSSNDTEIKLLDIEATEEAKLETSSEKVETVQNITLNHEVVKITIITEEHSHTTVAPIVFEVTTKSTTLQEVSSLNPIIGVIKNEDKSIITTTIKNENYTNDAFEAEATVNVSISNSNFFTIQNDTSETVKADPTILPNIAMITEIPTNNTTIDNKNINVTDYVIATEIKTSVSPFISTVEDVTNITEDSHEEYGTNYNSSDTLDDFNSPLLSGANEPVRRPIRSRRPQQAPNRNKFNPFRILG
ncbi:unnamed protein product [Arctia plantaginis]|uniref:C-type lectin domain-containing protein n=1 Tax=Arctia plantaginis TaxID=874455 RepID=A0A8S1AL87_ARCPL|nr:unnamed protein product [Arctia plantaginis]